MKRTLYLDYVTTTGQLRAFRVPADAVDIDASVVRISKWVAYVCCLLNGDEDLNAPSINMDEDASEESEYVYIGHRCGLRRSGFSFYTAPYSETAYANRRAELRANRQEQSARNR